MSGPSEKHEGAFSIVQVVTVHSVHFLHQLQHPDFPWESTPPHSHYPVDGQLAIPSPATTIGSTVVMCSNSIQSEVVVGLWPDTMGREDLWP